MRSRSPTSLAWLVLLSWGAGACVGAIEDPTGGEGTSTGTGRTPTDRLPEFAPAPASMHRLTYAEYRATLGDLLPPGTVVPTDLEVDTPLHGFTTIGASELTVSPRAAEQYEEAAMNVAAQVLLDPSRRASFVGCEITSPTGDPCLRVWLADFGRLAWRRLLTDAEIEQLATLAEETGTELGDPWVGAGFAMTAMLQSPYFLFRVEIGEPDPDGEARRYTSVEMASRLSYFLWGSGPDAALLDAGARGELVTDDGIAGQVDRMLDDPRARRGLTRFFSEFMSLDRLQTVSKDAALFPEMTPTLRASMANELELLFQDVVFDRDADFRELLSTDVTYVSSELAALYGLPDPGTSEMVRTTLPDSADRGGIMGRAAVLTLWSHATLNSPTLRGKFIRTNLLCEDVPPPPPGVRATLDEETASEGTLRDRLERHRTDPACAGCHDRMDPLGFALEEYDPIGRFRTTDNGFPIDATATVDGTPVDGAGDLGRVLSESPKVAECIARRLYRFATGHLEIETEERQIRALGESFAEHDHSFRALVRQIALSDGFRLVGEAP